ncbi:hypothetical protein PENDEC_c014G01605 [Penicillium decumbens]|uniref:Uncharacterized protein n=1 Tax=Penicillium decumbens TaxID=69771 RepID=A0A1V6P9F6_PENDC|nr:hypothetical protein PENDEC_c014G01605 [Penicillium decumbens]
MTSGGSGGAWAGIAIEEALKVGEEALEVGEEALEVGEEALEVEKSDFLSGIQLESA